MRRWGRVEARRGWRWGAGGGEARVEADMRGRVVGGMGQRLGVLAVGFFLMAPEVAEDGAVGAEVFKASFGGYPTLVQNIDIVESR